MPAQAFRFLNLPAGLRLMVYEFIPTVTRHHIFPTPSKRSAPRGTLTLVTKTLECSILATCHLIHNEATPILAPKLAHLRAQPLRLMLHSSASPLCYKHSSLCDDMCRLAKRLGLVPTPSFWNPPPSRRRTFRAQRSFAAKCVSYLSYAGGAPTKHDQTRDVVSAVLTAADDTPGALDFAEVARVQANVWQGLGRFAASYTVVIDDGELGFKIGSFDGQQFVDLPMEGFDAEVWEREWAVGEEV